jgi:hypothetical protein
MFDDIEWGASIAPSLDALLGLRRGESGPPCGVLSSVGLRRRAGDGAIFVRRSATPARGPRVRIWRTLGGASAC